MATSNSTQQCLLSVTCQYKHNNVEFNAHLLREGFFFVGAACFHRGCSGALAASSGNWLQPPGRGRVWTPAGLGLTVVEGSACGVVCPCVRGVMCSCVCGVVCSCVCGVMCSCMHGVVCPCVCGVVCPCMCVVVFPCVCGVVCPCVCGVMCSCVCGEVCICANM